eukprot:TRINITY_DN10148_c0_g1_i1.p1 TRINITY_DN10148_c0_g1~~TRINITY_DN10148_c0_g1_i1.p1  ORF type:complete len:220 (+),score=73.80 TRINITY_DN10148_c0_g1_i1:23-682(+)
MSKINARLVSGDGQTRIVEIERRAPSFSVLQQQATRKYKATVQQFVFVLPTGARLAINNDNDLKRAIFESVGAKQQDVRIEVQVQGGKAVAAGSAQPVAQPVAQQPQQHHQQQQQHQQAAPAPAAGSSAIISFTLPGKAGGADKVKVAAAQQADSYHFAPEAAALDTLIEVELPSSKALVFKLTSASGKISQTFNMPFDVAPKDLSLVGTTVILKFPWM